LARKGVTSAIVQQEKNMVRRVFRRFSQFTSEQIADKFEGMAAEARDPGCFSSGRFNAAVEADERGWKIFRVEEEPPPPKPTNAITPN
jgi:hypothetical protein